MFKNIFAPKSVDALLSSFTKLKAELVAVADRAKADEDALTTEIEALRHRRGGAKLEAKRALAAAERIDSVYTV